MSGFLPGRLRLAGWTIAETRHFDGQLEEQA